MDLRQLEFFVAVAEERHFGRAADRLYVGQPAISQAIRRLERQLHLELFDRSGRQIRMTEAGERFLPHARAVLAAANAARAAAAELAERPHVVLRVGTCAGLGDHLHRVLRAFAVFAPTVEVQLESMSGYDRRSQVLAHRVDAAFTHDREAGDGIDAIQVWSDPLIVALPAAHPLAARSEVALTDLAELPLRLVHAPKNPALHDLILGACRDAGFQPVLAPSGGNLDNTLAEIGTGPPSWTVLYASRARRINATTESFRPLRAPGLEVSTYLLVRTGDCDRHLRDFVRACTQPPATADG